MDITIDQAIQITGICMGIVFLTLIFIMILIDVQKVALNLPNRWKREPKASVNENERLLMAEKPSRGKKVHELVSDEEIIMAAVASIEASSGQDMSKVRILELRAIG